MVIRVKLGELKGDNLGSGKVWHNVYVCGVGLFSYFTYVYTCFKQMFSIFVVYISECSSNTYGKDCSINCNCISTNVQNTTQSCDRVNGTCGCNGKWTGETCDVDVDECQENVCPNSFERCINTQGGFNCTCPTGYKRNETDTCVQGILN